MPNYVETLIGNIVAKIVNPLILLLLGIALAVFVWGVVESIRNADSDEGRTNGRRHMIWGLIGLSIMVSVFGIMCIIAGTLGLPNDIVSLIPYC